MAKTLSEGVGNYSSNTGGGKPSGTPWKKILPMAAIAIAVTVGAIALPVRARGPAEAAGQDVPPAATENMTATDTKDVTNAYQAGPAVSVSSGQAPVDGMDLSARFDEDTGDHGGADQLSVTDDPVDGNENVDEVALAAAAMEQPTGTQAEPAAEIPAATPEPEVQIVYVYVEKDPEPEEDFILPEFEGDTEGEGEGGPTDESAPPDWLVSADDSTPPDWLVPAEPGMPEWVQALDLIDRAMWKIRYEPGPLCQSSWAQIPCAVTDGTRAYVEFEAPLVWLQQADLIYFAGNSIRHCDADWFTVYGSDGYGIQFPGCNVEFAVYGPLNEYGEVTEVVRYIFLTEDGYCAVEPGPVD